MTDRDDAGQNSHHFGDAEQSTSLDDEEFIGSCRWDTSCKAHDMSADLYLELLKSPPRRHIRSPSHEAGSHAPYAKSASDDWTETTASESFSGDTSLGSSLSSIGVSASSISPYPADALISPNTKQPSPSLTTGIRSRAPSIHLHPEPTFPFLDAANHESEADYGISTPALLPGDIQSSGPSGPLRTLVEDEEEDATSSSRQDDSFQQNDDEFELVIPATNEWTPRNEQQGYLTEKGSFSDSSENFFYNNDETDSYDDDSNSGSDDMSDDYMIDYLTSSDEESEEDIPSPTEFHAPRTSIASLDKLPTRDRESVVSKPIQAAQATIDAVTVIPGAVDHIVNRFSAATLADCSPPSVTSDPRSGFTERRNDSLDSLPKLPNRWSNVLAVDAALDYSLPGKVLRRVRFAPTCKVQEYVVTVGDNPSCSGPCALTLDWEHSPAYQQVHGQVSGGGLKCLSLASRRERIMQVQGLTEQRLRLLELQVSNRLHRNALIAKMKKKGRSGGRSRPDAHSPRDALSDSATTALNAETNSLAES